MSNMDELSQELFGNPEKAISDIKIYPGPDAKNSNPEEIAGMILAAIQDIRNGGGREIDLSI